MSWKQTAAYQQKSFKSDAVRIAGGLNSAKIACALEYAFLRVGEYKNGHPLSYVVDILLIDPRYRPVAIEVEGDGSSSRDNEKRDQYLGKLGISVMHVPNKVKSSEVIEQLERFYRVKD